MPTKIKDEEILNKQIEDMVKDAKYWFGSYTFVDGLDTEHPLNMYCVDTENYEKWKNESGN